MHTATDKLDVHFERGNQRNEQELARLRQLIIKQPPDEKHKRLTANVIIVIKP